MAIKTIEDLIALQGQPLEIGPSYEKTQEALIAFLRAGAQGVKRVQETEAELSTHALDRYGVTPILKKIQTAKDKAAEMNQELQDDVDADNATKMWLAQSGVDLFDWVPSTNVDLQIEVAAELVPLAKIMAFLPPVLIKRLTKAIDVGNFKKVVKELAEESPPIRQLLKLAEGDEEILVPLLEQARTKPHVRVHAGPVKFTGDEIDMRKAGGGSGGDLMGQGLYETEKPKVLTKVTEGYLDNINFNKAQADDKWGAWVREAKKELEDQLGLTIVTARAEGQELAYKNMLNKRALDKWKAANPDDAAQLSQFSAPAGSIPYVTDVTELTPVQAKAMYNALPNALRGLGLDDEAVERVMLRVHNPHNELRGTLLNPSGSIRATDKNPDLFMNSMDSALGAEIGPIAAKGKVGRNLINRLRMDIGYDELEYPSGQVFEKAQGHRNFLTTRPEILGTGKLDEPIIGRENYTGAEQRELLDAMGPDVAIEKRVLQDKIDFWDGKVRRHKSQEYTNFGIMHRMVGNAPQGRVIRVQGSVLRQMGLVPTHYPRSRTHDLGFGDYEDDMFEWPVDHDVITAWGKKVGYKPGVDGDPIYELDKAHWNLEEYTAEWGVRGGQAKNALGRLTRGRDIQTAEMIAAEVRSLEQQLAAHRRKAGNPNARGPEYRDPVDRETALILEKYLADARARVPDVPKTPVKKTAPEKFKSAELKQFEKNVDPIYRELRENAEQIGDQESLSMYVDNVPLGIRQAWAKLEAPVSRARFLEVGDLQRGAPESAMNEATWQMGGGVMQPALEHVGDIIHRLSDSNTFDLDGGYDFAVPKVEKALRWLKSKYGFKREFMENLAANFDFYSREGWGRGVKAFDTYDEFEAHVFDLMKKYADEHKKLVPLNRAQELSQKAAVALGEQRFDDVIEALTELQSHAGTRESWKAFVHEGVDI